MQDPENTRKRVRIRTRVQGPSSKHTFSLNEEKGGERSVRVVMSDGKSEKNVPIGEGLKNPFSQSSENPDYNRREEYYSRPFSEKSRDYVVPRSRAKRSMPFDDAKASFFQHPKESDSRNPAGPTAPESFCLITPRHQGSKARPRTLDGFDDGYKSPPGGFQESCHSSFRNRGEVLGKQPRNNVPHPRKKKGSRGTLIQPASDFVPTYPEEKANSTEPIRLNKFLANSGICSRRNADKLISEGRVKVNGEVITTMGVEITRQDVVEYDGKTVSIEPRVYVLLNKPKNCMTTSDDPDGRLTVMDLVKNACKERIFPVGRLDRNTTGVLLLTNDGDMMAKLLHPSFLKKKIYQVTLDRPVEVEHMQQIVKGIELEDGEIHADAVSYVDENDFSVVGIEIHSGRNRIVRRIFEHFGYRIYKLDRVYFAGLTKKDLPRGRWRYLTEEEVRRLRMGNYE